MSFLTIMPEYLASAANDLAGIGSSIGAAGSSAAAATTSVLPAGADEISAAISALFGAHGQAFQTLNAQAARFHEQFVQTMRSAGAAFAGAEAANVSPLQAIAAATSPMQQLEQAQIAFNSNLVANELSFNNALVANELALERSIFGSDTALNGVINRGFNAGNLLVGTGEQAFNALVGAQVPASFTSSLLTGSAAQVFNSGAIGGPLGAFDQTLAAGANFAGLFVGGPPGQALLSVLPAPAQSLLGSPASFLHQIETAQINFNTNLVNGETTFNQNLVTNEVAWEQQVFHTDSALNGFLNRSFNVGNMLLGAGQQAFNLFSGAQVPVNFNSGLLLGTAAQPFNGGQIGGLLGAFDQSMAAGLDLAGLITGT
ncbi:PE family protein [Mycobacterium sp. TY814]|uniref:PE family protein n=1 Tax=unclassified Mycobacterium TaxID=2642494 RepID=UPI00274050B5|nr:PE family protein [Mycobacterium sp. TY814]MDP7724995.1 PE family protein [Mycobacterium sp. TY814]